MSNPAVDRFDAQVPQLHSTCAHAVAVTPDDNNDLAEVSRYLYVGGAGTLAVVTRSGETVSFGAVTAGALIPLRVARVKATGTTATNLVALW